MDLRNHQEFVAFLNSIPRAEIAIHGLHHISRGRSVSIEFQHQERAACAGMLAEAIRIFEESGLRFVRAATAGMELRPPPTTSLPRRRDRMGSIRAGYSKSRIKGRQNSDVRITWRKHVVW